MSLFLILFLNYLLLFVIQMVIFDIDSWGEKIWILNIFVNNTKKSFLNPY